MKSANEIIDGILNKPEKLCKNCKYVHECSDYYECRRFPPQISQCIEGDDGSVWSNPQYFWPNVDEQEDWCGEFKAKGTK